MLFLTCVLSALNIGMEGRRDNIFRLDRFIETLFVIGIPEQRVWFILQTPKVNSLRLVL